MTLTASLVSTAQRWRNSNQEYVSGIVLISQGAAYGWKDCLRDASDEQPGSFAVDSDGHVFVAVGGNECGAEYWQAFSEVDPDIGA